jgi:hypothetical protein
MGVDRVQDIWGRRTPHARGTAWPVRVDEADTSRQLSWQQTRIEQAAPQALIVAS